jgi:hypothetical protein
MIPVRPIEEDLSGEEVIVTTSFDRLRSIRNKEAPGRNRKGFNKKEESLHSFKSKLMIPPSTQYF